MEGIVPVNLLLMANTIQKAGNENVIQKVYDLKGSFNNRMVHRGENQTMKDRNLLSCKKTREREAMPGLIQFDPNDKKKIDQIVESDTRFLQALGLLDYSLLLAVEKLNKKEQASEAAKEDILRGGEQKDEEDMVQSLSDQAKERHRFFSTCGNYVYHIAIIDYLTEFSIQNRWNRFIR